MSLIFNSPPDLGTIGFCVNASNTLEAILWSKNVTTTPDIGYHAHNKHIEKFFFLIRWPPFRNDISLSQVPICEKNQNFSNTLRVGKGKTFKTTQIYVKRLNILRQTMRHTIISFSFLHVSLWSSIKQVF